MASVSQPVPRPWRGLLRLLPLVLVGLGTARAIQAWANDTLPPGPVPIRGGIFIQQPVVPEQTARPASGATPPPSDLLELTVEPQQQIYTAREAVMLRFNFRALKPVRLCFEKDPLAQFSLKITRAGIGPLALYPLLVQDNSMLLRQPPKVYQMNPGDSIPYRANLKRIKFANGERWQPADYAVSAVFRLCDQRAGSFAGEGRETLVPSTREGRFMIME